MAEEYLYAVARIHSVEDSLLGAAGLQQLLACRSYDEAVRQLADFGYGDCKDFADYEEMLTVESEKTWQLVRELVGDSKDFEVFRLSADYHNIKAAAKAVAMNVEPERVFMSSGTVSAEEIYTNIKNKSYDNLPPALAAAARKAHNTMSQTGDGQLCDVLTDSAGLAAMLVAAKRTRNDFIIGYVELYVALMNIKIAIRAEKVGKTDDFMAAAIVDCAAFSAKELTDAALADGSIIDFIAAHGFADAAKALESGMTCFERFCDDKLMDYIIPQRLNCFTIAPLAAYILARESEIKAVRLVLAAKLNQLDEATVSQRIRRMYV